MEFRDYDIKEAYRSLMWAKEHHRKIDDIVSDLRGELRPIKEESLLKHAMMLILELGSRASSPLYTHLQSPMRQALYMIDVYYSIEDTNESVDMDMARWNRISLLLNEIEMSYFVSIGFPNDGELFHDERDEMISVSLPTFMDYFGNAVLSYEEQTLDKIQRYFTPYSDFIKCHFGFSINEAVKFIFHIRKIINDKLNDIARPYVETVRRYRRPEEWRKLTRMFEERGAPDPEDWLFQPELSGMLETMMTNPAEVQVHYEEELLAVDIPSDSLRNIIDFFVYDKNAQRGKTVYYADKHNAELRPIIMMGEKYLCPVSKFLLESLYFRIDEFLTKNGTTGKYKRNKDNAFEQRVLEMFRGFFSKETPIFSNYSIDGIAENDLLVIWGEVCIVVEIKNCGFREPFRDPIKAFPRIKKDYENAVQLGYDQCKRVEDVLLSGKNVDILDANDKHRVLYHLKSKRIDSVWLMVVTDYRYGIIQTDLSKMLKKDENALYPWSVCADDLESMFLLMRKMLKSIAPARFIEFLDYRERFQGHLLCSDELEMCGWYLCDREQFKECAEKDVPVNTSPNMCGIFEAYYKIGLGFKNELDIEYKKHYPLPDHPKHFELNEMTGEKIRGMNKDIQDAKNRCQ